MPIPGLQRLAEGRPREERALHPDRKLLHAFERLQVAQVHVARDRPPVQEVPERIRQALHLRPALPHEELGEHRPGGDADGAPPALHRGIVDAAVPQLEGHLHLVPADGVQAVVLHVGIAEVLPSPRGAEVIQDHVAVQSVEIRERGVQSTSSLR
jgi:hypothetical protein